MVGEPFWDLLQFLDSLVALLGLNGLELHTDTTVVIMTEALPLADLCSEDGPSIQRPPSTNVSVVCLTKYDSKAPRTNTKYHIESAIKAFIASKQSAVTLESSYQTPGTSCTSTRLWPQWRVSTLETGLCTNTHWQRFDVKCLFCPVTHTLHTRYTRYTHVTHTLHTRYTHVTRTLPLHTRCTHVTHTLHTHVTHTLHTRYRYTHVTHTLHTCYTHVTHTLHTRYTHVTHTWHTRYRYTHVTHMLHTRYTHVTHTLHTRYTHATHTLRYTHATLHTRYVTHTLRYTHDTSHTHTQTHTHTQYTHSLHTLCTRVTSQMHFLMRVPQVPLCPIQFCDSAQQAALVWHHLRQSLDSVFFLKLPLLKTANEGTVPANVVWFRCESRGSPEVPRRQSLRLHSSTYRLRIDLRVLYLTLDMLNETRVAV